jgi:hypothetical protein
MHSQYWCAEVSMARVAWLGKRQYPGAGFEPLNRGLTAAEDAFVKETVYHGVFR